MARARTIKPGFFKNEELGECGPLVRLFFAGLWTEADRRGILEDRPKRLKAAILPYDDFDPEAALEELERRGFVRRYEADGARCIFIENFAVHQSPHYKEVPSDLPAPDGYVAPASDGDDSPSGQRRADVDARSAPEPRVNPARSFNSHPRSSNSRATAPPTPPPKPNGRADAAAAENYVSVIGEKTCSAVADQFRRVDPSLAPGWFGAMLSKAQTQCGPAQRPQLEEAVKVTLSEVERRLAAERNGGGGTPVFSVKKFTEAVFVRNLSDALGVRQ